MKKKVFSWVVVFDFMVLNLYQKVLWHHKMRLDSKISSQKISENTLSYSKSMLSTHEKNWKNIMIPSKWPIFDNIDVAWYLDLLSIRMRFSRHFFFEKISFTILSLLTINIFWCNFSWPQQLCKWWQQQSHFFTKNYLKQIYCRI